jgi:8-oxo-dGTP pyrophosphatase MutT (NUDIX family)
MKARAAVILIQNDKITLIERHRSGRHYFVFPGGKIKAGETPATAAKREIMEELGLEVKIGQMVAEVWYQGSPQYYFLADRISGQFGHGTGTELNSSLDSEKGSYRPIWLRIDDFLKHQVLPKLVADFVWKSHHSKWPENPLVVKDNPPDELV